MNVVGTLRLAITSRVDLGNSAAESELGFEIIGKRRAFDDFVRIVSHIIGQTILSRTVEIALATKSKPRAAKSRGAIAVTDSSTFERKQTMLCMLVQGPNGEHVKRNPSELTATCSIMSFLRVLAVNPGGEAVTFAGTAISPVAATERLVGAEPVSNIAAGTLAGIDRVGGSRRRPRYIARRRSNVLIVAILRGRAAPPPLGAAVAIKGANSIAENNWNEMDDN